MQARQNSEDFGWPHGLHMVPSVAYRVRSAPSAGDASGCKARGACGAGESARISPRAEGRDGAAARAKEILDAVKDGADVMPGQIRWALRQTGDL
jgi:hypothetical protein